MPTATENGQPAPPELKKEPLQKGACTERALETGKILHVYQHSIFLLWVDHLATGCVRASNYFQCRTVNLLLISNFTFTQVVGLEYRSSHCFGRHLFTITGSKRELFHHGPGDWIGRICMHYLGAWEIVFRSFPALLIS